MNSGPGVCPSRCSRSKVAGLVQVVKNQFLIIKRRSYEAMFAQIKKTIPNAVRPNATAARGNNMSIAACMPRSLLPQTAKSAIFQSRNEICSRCLWSASWCFCQTKDSDQGRKTATRSNTLIMASCRSGDRTRSTPQERTRRRGLPRPCRWPDEADQKSACCERQVPCS